MTKKQLAQKRNYFKYQLMGMIKAVDNNILTDTEIIMWNQLKQLKTSLVDNFDNMSKEKGLNVPLNKCWCGKEAKNELDYYLPGGTIKWLCNKHFEKEKLKKK